MAFSFVFFDLFRSAVFVHGPYAWDYGLFSSPCLSSVSCLSLILYSYFVFFFFFSFFQSYYPQNRFVFVIYIHTSTINYQQWCGIFGLSKLDLGFLIAGLGPRAGGSYIPNSRKARKRARKEGREYLSDVNIAKFRCCCV